jgi:hypothetical protein
MGEVDDDAEVVHLLDCGDAEIAEAGVGALGAAIAQQIAGVVGELNAARVPAV